MSEEWKEEFFDWKDEIESKYNDLSESRIKYENKIKELEKWKKVEEEQHQNITKALDNFVIDAGAIGDSVYSNKLKSLENEIAEQKKMIEDIEETIVLNTCREITKPYCPMRIADLNQIKGNKEQVAELQEKVNYLEARYKESGGLRCLRDRGLIKEVLRDVFSEMKDYYKRYPDLVGIFRGALEKLDSSPESPTDKTEKKEIDYKQCDKCGWNLSYGCSQQERRPKVGDVCPIFKEASGGEKEFICGNCGKKFKAYHDGQGINTGYCPNCLTEYDTVGLDSKLPKFETKKQRAMQNEGVDLYKRIKEKEKIPEPIINPCSKCKHEFPSISQKCKSCCNTESFDGFEPKEKVELIKKILDSEPSFICKKCGAGVYINNYKFKGSYYCVKCIPETEPNGTDDSAVYHPNQSTEPEKNKVPWECPICHKTAYIGYTVHKHCLDKLIEGFSEKLEFLRDKVLEAPIISGSVQDLRDHTHDIKDLVIKTIKEYEGMSKK